MSAEIEQLLSYLYEGAGFAGVKIEEKETRTRVAVYVKKPGYVIGKKGIGMRMLSEILSSKFDIKKPQISVLESSKIKPIENNEPTNTD